MLAVVGYLVTAAGVRFPGAEGVPAGFKAFSTLYNDEVPGGLNVLMQFMFTTLLMEIMNGDRTDKAEFPKTAGDVVGVRPRRFARAKCCNDL